MDEESWQAMQDHHPQFGLKHLLETLNVDRSEVREWPHERANPVVQARGVLARCFFGAFAFREVQRNPDGPVDLSITITQGFHERFINLPWQ